MRTLTVSVVLLVTASASAQERSSVFEQALDAGLRPRRISYFDEFLRQQVQEKQVAGVVVLVARNGKVGYRQTIGFRDIDSKAPMTNDTIFRLASMTKPMVAVTAMMLWEEDKFRLDDPIGNVLPEWKDMKVQQGDELVPATSPITPRMLMTHTAGLDDSRLKTRLDRSATSDEASKALAARPLINQPGTKYVYAYSFSVLGRYIGVLEGKTLDEVMQERLFGPLKLKDTGFWLENNSSQSRVATVHAKSDGKLAVATPEHGVGRNSLGYRTAKPVRVNGDGGVLSTADDYFRFAQMLVNKGELDGQRFLKPETVDLMFQNHTKNAIGRDYGLGGAVDGKGHYAWGGSHGTEFWVNTTSETCGIFMIQTWDEKTLNRRFRGLARVAAMVGDFNPARRNP